MSTIITRLYKDRGTAAEAAAALERLSIGGDAVRVVARDAAPADADAAARHLANVLAGLQLQGAAAAAYAKEAVRTGGTLVVAQAAFGRAGQVLFTLDRFDPIPLPIADRYVSAYSGAWLSDAFGVPTLSDNSAPFSRMLGLPLLTRGSSSGTRLPSEPAPFSRMLGLPVLTSGKSNTSLSDNPAPFSRMLGLPLLTGGKSNTSLSSNPAPFSSALGLPTLTRSGRDDY